jgi:peptide/nickel transport system permease protein
MSEASVAMEFRKPNPFKEIWRRLKKDNLAIFGLTVIVLMILLAICANLVSDYDTVIKLNVKQRL